MREHIEKQFILLREARQRRTPERNEAVLNEEGSKEVM